MRPPDQVAPQPAVQMTGIVKRFDGVAANDRIDFTIRPGEIHALVGENGAGKSTLMNVLAGVYKPDAGEIRLFDRPVRFRSPRDAIRAGVGMVHQHFAQIPSCTVAQNMALADPDAPFFFDRRRIGEKIRELGERTGIRLDPDALVERLSIGEQQRLELLRLLANDARVLILDEPTAALTPGEADELFALLQALAKRGRAIVFITHKLDEVEACAERVTVLSCGRAVATDVPLTQCCREEIVGWMVGQAEPAAAERAARAPGAVVLELAGVAAEPAGAGAALRDVKLAVRAGEIVAIAGVAGNGQRELAETIVGLRPLASGRRLIGGEDASDWPPWRIRCAGVGFVPEDRLGCGVCPNLSLAENLNLASFGPGASFFPDGERLRCRAADRAAAWKIGRQDLGAPVRFLSGGNVQRAILAREIAAGEKLLLAAQPTRGLDIGAVAAVRAALLARRNAGVAVLLISYDLDEIFEVADRIAVMARGRLVAEFSRPFPDRAVIGMAMLGGPARAH